MTSKIRTLLPMAADGVGPSFTCTHLVNGFLNAGADIDLLVNRSRIVDEPATMSAYLTGPMAKIPYKYISSHTSKRLEKWFLSRLEPNDIAWLWPSVSLTLQEAVHARGNKIVLEGINTRMASAKAVLDAAYDAFGVNPAHGITEVRIVEEDQKMALADSLFTPSPAVELALKGTSLENKFMSTSYGVDTSKAPPFLPPRAEKPIRYLFCGYVCIRKGAHHLLDIWSKMPSDSILRLVGRIEPAIAERYSDLLASDRVECIGFTRDVSMHYSASDVFVFPSLEEGDPLVTYEAAHHGLPIVASSAGAGRMGAEKKCVLVINPDENEAFLETLLSLYKSASFRHEWGEKARRSVIDYDWNLVGARRLAALSSL